MADLTYTADQTTVRNRARLIDLRIHREVDGNGVLTGNIVVSGVAQVGHWNGSTFTVHGVVDFSERRSTTATANYFGAAALLDLETKVLQRMQTNGQLPAGNIS